MSNILNIMNKEGRICAISFHSLEDRIVKHRFTELAKPARQDNRISKYLPEDTSNIKVKWVTKKCKAQLEELNANVRSRSAILRVVEKL